MKCGGAQSQVERALVENRVLKWRDHDGQGGDGIVSTQELGQPRIRFDGHQRVGAELEQTTRRGARTCADLEDRGVLAQAASRDQGLVDPIGVWRPSAMVARGVLAEGL